MPEVFYFPVSVQKRTGHCQPQLMNDCRVTLQAEAGCAAQGKRAIARDQGVSLSDTDAGLKTPPQHAVVHFRRNVMSGEIDRNTLVSVDEFASLSLQMTDGESEQFF